MLLSPLLVLFVLAVSGLVDLEVSSLLPPPWSTSSHVCAPAIDDALEALEGAVPQPYLLGVSYT